MTRKNATYNFLVQHGPTTTVTWLPAKSEKLVASQRWQKVQLAPLLHPASFLAVNTTIDGRWFGGAGRLWTWPPADFFGGNDDWPWSWWSWNRFMICFDLQKTPDKKETSQKWWFTNRKMNIHLEQSQITMLGWLGSFKTWQPGQLCAQGLQVPVICWQSLALENTFRQLIIGVLLDILGQFFSTQSLQPSSQFLTCYRFHFWPVKRDPFRNLGSGMDNLLLVQCMRTLSLENLTVDITSLKINNDK